MKANSRRRVLISSVAMLLVALVALSTATYAWFTQNTEAYADGIHVRTTKVSELQINSKLDTEWRTHVAYGVGTSTNQQLIMPASTADGINWFYASAKANTSFEADSATKVTAALGNGENFNDYYFADELNIQNSGQVKAKDVKITIEGFTGDYARIAIVPVTEKGGNVIAETGKTFTDYIIDTEGETYNAAKGTTLKGSDVVSVTAKTSTVVNVGEIGAGDAVYYNVYVWFEGQDVDCKNINSGQAIPSIKLTVSGSSEADAA